MKNYAGRNLTMLTDLYELTMAQSYFNRNRHERVIFDVFYRKNPFGNGFAIACGIDDVVDYVKELHFDREDIDYLASLNTFSAEFLEYLSNFKFTGNMYAVENGTVVFPMEPIVKIEADICEAQIVETAILNIINHQTLIATKSERVKWAAGEDNVLEFGLRRAQGPDAGLYGAKAAIIGGCGSTSNVLAGQMFGAKLSGTHAHSYVMSFGSELEAFRAYVETFPNAAILLVDTYDTLGSGVPNAIKVFNEMKEAGKLPVKGSGIYGIRLDSGDLAWISKEARRMLDEAGFTDAIISASSDLDENLITSLKLQGAKITLWGVGTNLITAKDCPALGGVYKLAAVEENGEYVPKIKLSENPEKITNPGNKRIIRIVDNKSGLIRADLICLADEVYDEGKDLEVFDPVETWKRKVIKGGTYHIVELHKRYFNCGIQVGTERDLAEAKQHCEESLAMLSQETRRLVNPHKVHVDLSDKLWNLKNELIAEIRK
jgi:nicotinate phosphoribosyltransferase